MEFVIRSFIRYFDQIEFRVHPPTTPLFLDFVIRSFIRYFAQMIEACRREMRRVYIRYGTESLLTPFLTYMWRIDTSRDIQGEPRIWVGSGGYHEYELFEMGEV